MNKDIHNIFENYLLIESTEPELLSKDVYKFGHDKDRLGLEYHFKHNKKIYSIILSVEVDMMGAYKAKDDGWSRSWIFIIKKNVRFAWEADRKDSIPLLQFNYNPDLEFVPKPALVKYDLVPLMKKFYSIVKQDIEEHNNKVLFNGHETVSDTFGDLYNEL